MTTEPDLLDAIRQDFGDTKLQLVYADFLDDSSNRSFASYVRLMADLLATPEDDPLYCELQMKRRAHLDSEPSCWQWDDFLSLRHIPAYRSEIRNQSFVLTDGEMEQASPPADVELVEKLEAMIGCSLPHGYRGFLTDISDGSIVKMGVWDFPPVIYSVSRVIEGLEDADALARARDECKVTWEKMMAGMVESEWFRDDEQQPPGFIQIGVSRMGGFYLAISGQLRGTIWFCGEWDEVLTTATNSDMGEYAECKCADEVQAIPQDTMVVIRELVLERWDEVKHWPDGLQ